MGDINVDKIIEKYQAGNKAIRQRLSLLGLFWLIVFGLFLIRHSQIEDWNMAAKSENALRWMLVSPDSSLNRITNLDPNDPLAIGVIYIGKYVENWDTLSERFALSRFKDKAPIKRALFELHRKQVTLFKDPTISFFGVELTFDPWYYLGLLIILILLHDLTRIIFYQKDLKLLLVDQKIEAWQFGFDDLDYFETAKSASGKFVHTVSSLLFGIILISPVAASLLTKEIKPFNANSNLSLEILNSLFLFLIIIHTTVLFYTENIFKTRNLIDFLTSKGKVPSIGIYALWILAILSDVTTIIPWTLKYPSYPSEFIKVIFITLMTLCIIAFPLSIWLSNKYSNLRGAKVMVFASFWLYGSALLAYHTHEEIRYDALTFVEYSKKFLCYAGIICASAIVYSRFLSQEKKQEK